MDETEPPEMLHTPLDFSLGNFSLFPTHLRLDFSDAGNALIALNFPLNSGRAGDELSSIFDQRKVYVANHRRHFQ